MKRGYLILVAVLLITTSALHLHLQAIHNALSPVLLQSQLTAAIQNLTSLNSSLTLTMAGLNPFNQQQRITSL